MVNRSGVPADPAASLHVASWAYGQTARVGGLVWVNGRATRHLGSAWERLFAA